MKYPNVLGRWIGGENAIAATREANAAGRKIECDCAPECAREFAGDDERHIPDGFFPPWWRTDMPGALMSPLQARGLAARLQRETAAAAAHSAAVAAAALAATAAAAADAATSPFAQLECAYCGHAFDDNDCVPRKLACCHTFCTACVEARTRKTGPRTRRFTCPVDDVETVVRNGDASTLPKNSNLVLAEAPLFRIYLRNMAGDTAMLIVSATTTVGEVKRALHVIKAVDVYRLQLSVPGSDDEYAVLEDDAAMLGALDIDRERVVAYVVQDPYGGGHYVRTIQCLDFWPKHVSASPYGELLFCCNHSRDRVLVLRASDGAHLHTISASGVDVDGDAVDDDYLSQPFCSWSSHDGSLLFVALARRVVLIRALDGLLVRILCESNDVVCGMCVSVDDEYLYTTHVGVNGIRVWRVSDGTLVHSLELAFAPGGFCRSPDGKQLFVITADQRIAVVRATDGAHTRSIEIPVPDRDDNRDYLTCVPSDVCTSRDGKLLFVSDFEFDCVHVLCVSDGSLVRSFGERGDGDGDGQLIKPSRVCLSASGESLFVTDGAAYNRKRIQVFDVRV